MKVVLAFHLFYFGPIRKGKLTKVLVNYNSSGFDGRVGWGGGLKKSAALYHTLVHTQLS